MNEIAFYLGIGLAKMLFIVISAKFVYNLIYKYIRNV